MTIWNKDEFERQMQETEKLVLVDFFADWCGPCKMLAPVLEEIEEENSDELLVVQVNVDENMELAFELSVLSLPTVILYEQGKEKDRMTGLASKKEILDMIK